MATSLYRVLLFVLPGWFREEFAAEMAAVFRDQLPDARRLGGVAPFAVWTRTLREVWALAVQLHADALRQDLTYALRTLRRAPTFTLAAIATLAIAMGPTLVVANLLQQVVWKPLPFPESDRLVSVWNAQPEKNRHQFPLSTPDYADFREGQTALAALAAHTGTSVAFVGAGEPRQIGGVLATAELFEVLKLVPVLGRPFTRADNAPGAPPVVILGADFWRSEFGARADVIGQVVRIDDRPTEVVGVLPEVDFPEGSRHLWVPLTLDPATSGRGSHFLNATGRLAPGVSPAQASDVLNGIARSLAEQYPSTNAGNAIEIIRLKEQLSGDSPRLLTVLAVAVVAVLLIACTNVAGLLAVRATLRQSELAVRTAMGANLRRLRRQLLIEHLLVALGGAMLAVAIAVPMHRLLVEQRLLALPRTTSSTVEWPAFAALSAVVVLVGLALARLTTRRPAVAAGAAALLSPSRQTGGRSQLRARQALVIVEVAGALALAVVAGLMIRSAVKLARVDPGFRTENVVTFGVVLPSSTHADAKVRLQFVDRVIEELRALPLVRAVASGAYAPMGQMRATRRYAPADQPLPAPGAEPLAIELPVGPGYFEVMGVPLLAGRTFDERDTTQAPPVTIVSEAFAREVFPGESAVGKKIGFYASRPGATPPPPREIVGVVGDVRQDGMRTTPIPQMYPPYAQATWIFTSFFVRVDGDPGAVVPLLQRAVSRVDPGRPVRDVKTTSEVIRGSTTRQRAMTWMLGVLAAIALLLATIGLYGISATTMSARSRELAIRAAVGARPATLVRLVLVQGVITGSIGVAVGALVGLAATRGIGALLYETPPGDPVTFLITAALLLAVAITASYLPARRALVTNPADVLRTE
jgi:putative ABC transport system permease protein